jgi:hypothetical protein
MNTPTLPVTGADATVNGSKPAAPEPSVLFEVIRMPGGWNVDEDGRLYGEYANEAQALAAASKAAKSLIDSGGRAEITYGPVDRNKRS